MNQYDLELLAVLYVARRQMKSFAIARFGLFEMHFVFDQIICV